jgi:hypothetical protein
VATVVGITLIKKFTYRGDPLEEFSNDYHFTGSVPADGTAWLALIDALVAQEKLVYGSGVAVIAAYGYDSDDPTAHAVYSHTYTTPVAGTLTTSSGYQCPGDAAVWVRWKTSRLNSKGKPIYLRKYFHDAFNQGVGNVDLPIAVQVTALNTFGTKLFDGSFIDGRTIRSRAHAETITERTACTYITTRTLKRRGKRPS